jgi:virginiamycin B lyase
MLLIVILFSILMLSSPFLATNIQGLTLPQSLSAISYFSPSQNSSNGLSSSIIRNFTLPTPNAGPNAIVSGSTNGTLWFVEFSAGKIGEFFQSNDSFHEFSIPEKGAIPTSLAIDQFGTIWFSDQKAGSPSIWSFDPMRGGFKQYPIPTPKAFPLFILVDAEHNVWFTETTGYKIGELSYPSYSLIEYSFPVSQYEPLEMALDQNKSTIWMTLAQTTSEVQPGVLASFNMTSGKFESVYRPPFSLQDPVGIALDKDGNVWISEHRGSSIVEFNPSNLSWRKYQTSLPPASFQVGSISAPATLAIDNQGNLWFVEHFSNRVGKLDPSTGIMEEFTIPGPPGPNAYSVLNAIDPEGNFWFTNFVGNSIDMIPENATTNVLTKLVNADSGSQIPAVEAGHSIAVDLGIRNLASQTQELSLNATGSFSSDGVISTKQVSFNTTSFAVQSNQTVVIQVTVSPDIALASGIYSISVIASGENSSSTIQTFFIDVNASPLYFLYHLGDYFQYIAIVAILILAGIYFSVRRRLRKNRNNRSNGIYSMKGIVGLHLNTKDGGRVPLSKTFRMFTL